MPPFLPELPWFLASTLLFPTPLFVFGFLPIVAAGYFALARAGATRAPVLWLVGASAAYYAWWNPRDLALVAASIAFNFAVGHLLATGPEGARRRVLGLGVGTNLAALAWFKYAAFGASIFGAAGPAVGALPLGISFFTFTQIAYLVDAYRRETRPSRLADYAFFVTFFPHLVAGPILHHQDVVAQLGPDRMRFVPANVAFGLALFTIGLAKKVFVADRLAPFADMAFAHVQAGGHPSAAVAWGATLAYAFQLYFDFSGYSDMAIGLAKIFNVDFPRNFEAPYKATSIIDFWRRWHMTLSRFLRDYVYIPLGGSRKGPGRRFLNLFATMALGGLWHGAGWTYLVWGALHGAYLIANHAWRAVRARWAATTGPAAWAERGAGWLLTFGAVLVGWVFFRAADLPTAGRMLTGLAGLATWGADGDRIAAAWEAASDLEVRRHAEPALIAFAAAIALLAPRSDQVAAWLLAPPAEGRRPRPELRIALGGFALGAVLLAAMKAYWTMPPAAFLYGSF